MNSSTSWPEPKTLRMAEFVTLTALLTSLVALSIDAILPALDMLGTHLNAKNAQHQQLSVSLFFAGMAFGQLFFGPFADAKGRVPTILLGLAVFVLGSIICMLAKDMNTFLLGRVVQAFGASGPRIGALAAVRDKYSGNEMAQIMSFVMMVFIFVPMIAPILGQWVLSWYSWQALFVLFILVGIIGGCWYRFRQAETLLESNRKAISFKQLSDSLRFMLTHKQVMLYTFATGLIFGCFLAYLSASQTIFVGYYKAQTAFPYIFAVLALSIGLASYSNGKMVMRFGMHTLVRHALTGVMVFSFVLLTVVFVFNGLPPLWLLIGVLFIGFFFIGILFGNMNAMAMEHLGHIAGFGVALVGSLSSAISVPVAILIDSFLVGNLYPLAAGFLVFFSLAKYAVHIASK
jgi:DHA1 family bicyclomycin/chloramphenicol resistance-like MFS transporter